MTRTRLAVWGDPIGHSKSPQLHAAAYAVLGLDWEYGRRQIASAGFRAAIASLDDSWRGLSLTMPLKDEAHRIAEVHDRHALLTGVANTLLFDERLAAFNTDVGGIVDALGERDVHRIDTARILGGGATAASALVAVSDLGATRVDVRVRRPERAAALADLGGRLGVTVAIGALDAPPADVELTVATLPGGTALPDAVTAPLAAHGGILFDVAYSPWPSALSSIWGEAQSISGLGMLLFQAVRQIRIFVHGDPAVELPDEAAVVAAMRAAL